MAFPSQPHPFISSIGKILSFHTELEVMFHASLSDYVVCWLFLVSLTTLLMVIIFPVSRVRVWEACDTTQWWWDGRMDGDTAMTNAATKSSLVSAGPFSVVRSSAFSFLSSSFSASSPSESSFFLLRHGWWALISSYPSSSAASASSYMATYIRG